MDIFTLLDELQTIARNGIAFTRDPYDRERYEKLLSIAIRYYSHFLQEPEQKIREKFAAELGYVTPKVGSDAAIFDEEGRLLVMRRADNGKWCLPAGWLDPGESPEDGAVREVREETGLDVKVVQLVRIFSTPAGSVYGPHGAVTIVYLCKVTGGALRLSHEGTELMYRKMNEVTDWHSRHQEYAEVACEAWKKLNQPTSPPIKSK
jgi:ADP-ribose pyrophosphatase YjhB (NUDIX family)